MDKQDQDSFDLFDDFKTKRDINICNSPTMQNKDYLRKPRTFKNVHSDVLDGNTPLTSFNDFKYQTKTEQFAPVEIKEEIIECEMPKIEGCSNVQMSPKSIKQELDENSYDDKVTDIKLKHEISEYIQPKTESVVPELLTSECDLPTLKVESTDYYLDTFSGHSRKLLKNNSRVILKKKMRYLCPICQNNFPSAKSRSTHIHGHFKKRYAVCQFCGKILKKVDFFKHFFIHVVKNRMKNHIADKSLKCNIFSKKRNRKNIDDVDDKSFKYDTYDKTHNLKYNSRQHLSIHNGEKRFKCDICFKGFTHKSSLLRHLITIHKNPFKCDICSKGFINKQHLQQHLIIHTSKKLFKCDICSKGFINKQNLQQHLIIHTSNKPFKCDICSNCFAQKAHLTKHLMIHSGKKPFKCDICSNGFTNKNHLQRHLIIHSGKKPFICDICSKGFTQKANLRQHSIIHSDKKPFICNICSKCFNKKPSLQQHLIIHSGIKPFKCDICSKGFTRKSHLQQHLIVHSCKKPFKCNVCSKCFNDTSILRKHLRIHNKQ